MSTTDYGIMQESNPCEVMSAHAIANGATAYTGSFFLRGSEFFTVEVHNSAGESTAYNIYMEGMDVGSGGAFIAATSGSLIATGSTAVRAFYPASIPYSRRRFSVLVSNNGVGSSNYTVQIHFDRSRS